MIEKQVPGTKFDIDRKEKKAIRYKKRLTKRYTYLIVKTKTDLIQKTSHVFTKSNM